jgi:hypothetical protein
MIRNFAQQGQRAPTTVEIQPYLNLLASQDNTRATIAYIVIALLAVLVFASIAGIFIESVNVQRLTQVFGLTFGPVVGLVGTVVGFYFGAKTATEGT